MEKKEHKCLVHKKLKDEALNILNELRVKGFCSVEMLVILEMAKTTLAETNQRQIEGNISIVDLTNKNKKEARDIIKKVIGKKLGER